MMWYGWLILIIVIGGVVALMRAMYGRKDSPTPCIGCGACVNSGECVFHRTELERRKKMESFKAAEKARKIRGKGI